MNIQFEFHFRHAKPSYSKFSFGESGTRHVPVRIAGEDPKNLNTVTVFGSPDLVVRKGELATFAVEPLNPQAFKSVRVGHSWVEIWDGDVFAAGKIIEVQV